MLLNRKESMKHSFDIGQTRCMFRGAQRDHIDNETRGQKFNGAALGSMAGLGPCDQQSE